MRKDFCYDLLVIGSGPAGVHGAIQAAKLGKKVALIEKDPQHVGGAWIHSGTIPSKALREAVCAMQSISAFSGVDWMRRLQRAASAETLFGRAREVASREEGVINNHLKNNNIFVLRGRAHFVDAHTVCVKNSSENTGETCIRADKILIATGSSPRRPEGIAFDNWRIVDSDAVLQLDHIPQSMVIYGAGVIGNEYACIFNAMGTKVTVVDARAEMLRHLDVEATNELKRSMQSSGIRFVMGSKFESAALVDAQVEVKHSTGVERCDTFFFAAGRVYNTAGLELESVGVKITDAGCIGVNEHYQTSIPHIYAAGDIIGPPSLAATSSAQGRSAACHAFGITNKSFSRLFPIGIYTIPEMSSIGATEEELQKKNSPYVVGHALFSEIARGHIRGETHGLLKILVCQDSRKLLGVHIVGPDACNLIHIGQCLMHYGAAVDDLTDALIFNYPTLSECYRVAGFNAVNKILALSQRKAS